MALVFDILYHKNTIFLLHRNHFYTFALVPLQCSLYTVNFAIPISNESPFINLFFIRLLLHIKKTTKSSDFKQLSQVWSEAKFIEMALKLSTKQPLITKSPFKLT